MRMSQLYLLSLQQGARNVHRSALVSTVTTQQPHNGKSVLDANSSRSSATHVTDSGAANAEFFDCDLNLTHELLRADAGQLLARAHSLVQLKAAIVPGSDLRDSALSIGLAGDTQLRQRTGVRLYATAGIHPYNARDIPPGDFAEQLGALLSDDNVVAIGECGLDASPGFPSLDDQLLWFRKQLDIACDLQKPLFLHERGAFRTFMNEILEHKARLPSKVLVHCFTGTEDELRAYLEMGWYVSISGLVCRNDKEGKRFQAVLRAVQPPPNRLMIETDAPYMQFPGCRRLAHDNQWKDRPNDPTAINQVAQGLARALGRTITDVCCDCYSATCEFFGVEPRA